jgi:hypothetical protein
MSLEESDMREAKAKAPSGLQRPAGQEHSEKEGKQPERSKERKAVCK